jgi:hypothetical protein
MTRVTAIRAVGGCVDESVAVPRRRQIEAPRIDQRSRNPMVVGEEMHHMYRKMLNLGPMRDGGIMSASKFTARIHH